MLSDKEKEELQELINLLYNGHISQYGKRKLEKYIKKQSKEIEELKDFITKLQATKDRLDSYDKENTLEIEKLNKEIEELKAHQITFTNDYKPIGSKGKKFISEDKIKAKIEEYEKELNKLLQKEEWLEPHDTTKRNKYMHYIEFGQSLLEKE